MTVQNDQNMKCEIKGAVNMKQQGGKTVNLTGVLYVTQTANNILSVLRPVSNVAIIEAPKDKATIK